MKFLSNGLFYSCKKWIKRGIMERIKSLLMPFSYENLIEKICLILKALTTIL